MRHSRLLNLFNRVYLKLNFPIQLSNSILKLNSLAGLRPRPHARRGFSLRSSLLGASGFTQPTAVIMRHAKQSAPERPLKASIFLRRSGARFCSKGRRITLLSGAARMPIKGKSAKLHFKSNSDDFKVKGNSCDHALALLRPSQKLMWCLVLPAGKRISSPWEALGLDIKTTVLCQQQYCLKL
jgi:hypothetical protein